MDCDRLIHPHIPQLCLFEICRDPDVIQIHDAHQLLPRLNVLSHFSRAVSNNAVHRCSNRRVLQIQPCRVQFCFFLLD